MNTKNLFDQQKFKPVIASLIFSVSSMPILAATTTSTVQVSATIGAGTGGSCSAQFSAVNFGTYDSANNSPTTADVTIDCGGENLTWSLVIDGGNSGSPSNRYLLGSMHGEQLNYQIYRDFSWTIIWDETPFVGTGDFGPSTRIIGLIPSGQNVSDDTYSDTLIATVTF